MSTLIECNLYSFHDSYNFSMQGSCEPQTQSKTTYENSPVISKISPQASRPEQHINDPLVLHLIQREKGVCHKHSLMIGIK